MAHTKLVRELFDSYEKHKRGEIKSRRFTQKAMLRWMEPMLTKDHVEETDLGRSAEGRTISLYKYGSGSTKVLLWSQMHGDEPTATMALLDILNFFKLCPEESLVKSIRSNLTLLMIPMLNPDGAERFTRRTAQLVDMNRDAAALRTPEARILKDAQQKLQPHFGFNLHDQDPRLTVGSTKNVTAIALLAPALDQSRTDNEVRIRAKKVANVFCETMDQLVPGHVAKYDDAFDRRAFGDSIQLWGTSTVLVESGGWPNDRDKMFIRRLNYVGLLVCLHSIATMEFENRSPANYESLPFNSKNLYDIILRGVELQLEHGMPSVRVDIGINLEEVSHEGPDQRLIAKIVDVGDLSSYGAFEEREGKGVLLRATNIHLDAPIRWDGVDKFLKTIK